MARSCGQILGSTLQFMHSQRLVGPQHCRHGLMKKVIDTLEVLGTVEFNGEPHELCAEADARYHGGTGKLEVRLEAFLRSTNLLVEERHVTAPWLPAPQTLSEGMSEDEAVDAARDIFHGWVRKVRQ